MTCVPEDHIARRVENTVKGERQLDDTEVGAEMTPGRGHGVDDEGPDLLSEDRQLVQAQVAKVTGLLICSRSMIVL